MKSVPFDLSRGPLSAVASSHAGGSTADEARSTPPRPRPQPAGDLLGDGALYRDVSTARARAKLVKRLADEEVETTHRRDRRSSGDIRGRWSSQAAAEAQATLVPPEPDDPFLGREREDGLADALQPDSSKARRVVHGVVRHGGSRRRRAPVAPDGVRRHRSKRPTCRLDGAGPSPRLCDCSRCRRSRCGD